MALYSDQHEPSCDQQRLPMRKPMSMVEFWVKTGRQPYSENLHKSFSDSGSSLEEELIPEEYLNLSKLPVNSSLEKNYGNSIVQNKNEKTLTNTSNSSVDTADYIKANNNTTTKTETAAIIEISKSFHNKSSNRSQLELSTVENKSYNKRNKLKKREQNETNVKNRFSTSDESLYRSKYLEDSQNSDLTKFGGKKLNDDDCFHNHSKRKKLYNSQDSVVEFTPVSDESRSYKLLKSQSNISEHPALQTPMSQPKFLLKKKRSFKRKLKLINALDTHFELKDQSESKLSQLETSCENSKNLTITQKAEELTSNSLYENEYKKFLEKGDVSSDMVSKETFEIKPDSSNNSPNSLKNEYLKSSNFEPNKSLQESNIQLNNKKNLEKKIDLNNGTIDSSKTLKNKNHYKTNNQHDKYAIIFSEDDEDEMDVDNGNFGIESSDDNKSIEQLKYFDNIVDETSKIENNLIKKESITNGRQSKTLNGENKSKKVYKIISSPKFKKNKKSKVREEKYTNENIKLVKSDKKVSSIVNKVEKISPINKEKCKNKNMKPVKSDKKVSSILNKSEKISPKNKEEFINKNIRPVKLREKLLASINNSEKVVPKNKATEKSVYWKDQSFQTMKKIFKHTIVFSSSDESE